MSTYTYIGIEKIMVFLRAPAMCHIIKVLLAQLYSWKMFCKSCEPQNRGLGSYNFLKLFIKILNMYLFSWEVD